MTHEASWAVWRHLARARREWDLIVTDEVVSAIPFAHHVLEVPVVAITDWFFGDFGDARLDRAFDQAAEVIVLDFPQSHPRPPQTTAPVHHAGPIVDVFAANRDAARAELGADPDGLVAVLTLGGMPDRPETARMAAAVLDAWHASSRPGDRLHILADAAGHRPVPGVTWAGVTASPEIPYTAADVVIVDAMGFTACELVANGARVVALTDAETIGRFPASFRHRLDHMAGRGWIAVEDAACGPKRLWELIAGAHGTGAADAPPVPAVPPMPTADVADLARRVLKHA